MAEVDLYKAQKTAYLVALYGAEWTDVYTPENKDATGDLTSRPEEDWHNFARCKTATTEVETEDDPEDSFDAISKKRVRMQNTKVINRRRTYEMERQTLLYSLMFNGVKNPFSEETLSAVSSGKIVQTGTSSNPRVPICLKEETYDDDQNLLFTNYQYGYILTTGQQVSDGKISRPQLSFEEEPSMHSGIVYSDYYLANLA